MIFSLLKRKWMRDEIKKMDRSTAPRWISSGAIPRSMIVFYDADVYSNVSKFEHWGKQLQIKETEITYIGRVKNAKKFEVESAVLLDDHCIGWNGQVVNNALLNALEKQHDLQFNFYETEDDLWKYVACRSNAGLKVGYNRHSDVTFDIGIDVPLQHENEFLNETIKYLKILTK